MRVSVYVFDSKREVWEFEVTCPIATCFPDGDPETFEAVMWLQNHPHYTTGGGAAPLFKLTREFEGFAFR
jgi:hypothetical protein